MKAIIFVAGCGIRLDSDCTSPTPKVLLSVGGRTLLDWHCQRLLEVGIREIVLVVGFERAQVEAAVTELTAKYDCTIRTIVNERYEAGSVLSLAAAVPEITGSDDGLLLMDGDVLYPAAMLRRLVSSREKTCLLLDQSIDLEDPEPMRVAVLNGKIIDLRKQWDGSADRIGESIGFFKIAAEDIDLLLSEIGRHATDEYSAERHEDVIRELVLQGRMGFEDVSGLPWIEIDFPEDLAKAREQILPAVLHYELTSIWMHTPTHSQRIHELQEVREELVRAGFPAT